MYRPRSTSKKRAAAPGTRSKTDTKLETASERLVGPPPGTNGRYRLRATISAAQIRNTIPQTWSTREYQGSALAASKTDREGAGVSQGTAAVEKPLRAGSTRSSPFPLEATAP